MAKRIVIIEDSRDVGRMLQAAVTSIDATLSVQLYISAEEALLDAARNPVDLLVSDIRLPGKSGLELVREMRQRRPGCRVIIITGITDPAIVNQAKQIEADGFFQKPLNMTAFMETFRAALQKIEQTSAGQGEAGEKPSPVPPARRGTGWLRRLGTGALRARVKATPVAQQLMALRQSLAAQAVAILDESGKTLEVAGELLPDLWTVEWQQKISSRQAALHAGDPTVLVMVGRDAQVVITPLAEHILVVVLRPGRGAARPGTAVDELLAAQPALQQALQQGEKVVQAPSAAQPAAAELAAENPFIAPPVQPEPESSTPTPAPELDGAALDAFTQQLSSSAQSLDLQQASAFWDNLVNQPPDSSAADAPASSDEQ